MSYCRWSSMDYACDLYLYESCYGGWELHIAGNRALNVPKLPPVPKPDEKDKFDDYFKAYRKQMDFLETAKRVPIKLKYANESRTFEGIPELIEFLKELKRIGYIFPEHVIPTLEEELNA